MRPLVSTGLNANLHISRHPAMLLRTPIKQTGKMDNREHITSACLLKRAWIASWRRARGPTLALFSNARLWNWMLQRGKARVLTRENNSNGESWAETTMLEQRSDSDSNSNGNSYSNSTRGPIQRRRSGNSIVSRCMALRM